MNNVSLVFEISSDFFIPKRTFNICENTGSENGKAFGQRKLKPSFHFFFKKSYFPNTKLEKKVLAPFIQTRICSTSKAHHHFLEKGH